MASSIVIELIADASRMASGLGQAGSKLESFASKAQAVGAKMTAFATTPIVGIGAAAFKAAADVNESLSKVNAVFGESGKEIDKWAKGAAKSIGLSRGEALDAAGSFGNMFTQLGIGSQEAGKMSQSIVGLAADFASFHNADISQVIDAQSAAFRGEYDSLQRFLPLINAATVEQKAMEMTGKANAKELTAQEKALAVNTLMLEGAGTAMGDFARTSDSAANQQRILTAQVKDAASNLGTQLLPIGEKVLGWAAGLASKFASLSDGTQTVILVVAGLVAGLGPLIGLIGTLTTVMTFLAANPIVLVIAGIAALAAGLVIAYQKSETFRNIVNQAFLGLKTSVETMWHVVEPILNFLKRSLDALLGPLGSVLNMAGRVGGTIGGLVGKIPGFANGGVVPGAVGQPRLALVHGGERIIPNRGGSNGGGDGGTSLTVVVQGNVLDGRQLADMVQDALLAKQRRSGNLGFVSP